MSVELADGQWRYTEYDAIPPIGRRVRLPLYKFVHKGTLCPESVLDTHPPDEHGNRYVGRVIVDWSEEGDIDAARLAMFGPRDIVQWPLYYGGPHPEYRGAGTQVKLPQYDRNLSILREVASHLGGILLGNCGGELAFHHLLVAPDQRHREWCIAKDVALIEETGKLVTDAGGRPVYGPMEREVLIDAYHGSWRMAEAVKQFGGVMVIFQERGLFPHWTMIYGNDGQDGRHLEFTGPDGQLVKRENPSRQEWRDDYGVFVHWDVREPFPYPTLLAYFREHEIWHCIGYSDDFLMGADEILWQHKCRAVIY